MSRIRLIRGHAEEADQRAGILRGLGHSVDCARLDHFGKEFKKTLPDVYLIDLGRIPSHGREIGLYMRRKNSTRLIPLVFVDGAPEKVNRVKDTLPDATYCTWRGIKGALKKAAALAGKEPLVPSDGMASYKKVPLCQKLGIRAGDVVALSKAPANFERVLGRLPDGAQLRNRAAGDPKITLWFVHSHSELNRGLGRMKKFARNGGLWVAWPKKTSGVKSDLSQAIVRHTCMDSGYVDFKICKVDDTWSALRFSMKK